MSFKRGYLIARKVLVETSAKLSAATVGARLAPGRLRIPKSGEEPGQIHLLELEQELGPIFKVWLPHKMTTCIVGHRIARRFLSENEGKIRAGSPDLSPLFPHGFLRALEGEVHRKYRRRILDAFNNTPLEPNLPELRSIVSEGIASLAAQEQPVLNSAMRSTMKSMSTAVFILLILGVRRSDQLFHKLIAAYDVYAPDGPFIVVREHHKPAYNSIRDLVLEIAEDIKGNEASSPSLLKHLVLSDTLDETTMGNLIQMVEATRYDLHGLWCWVLKHLGDNPEATKIVRRGETGSKGGCSAVEAVPRESLRMEQSELLLRVATENIIFDGFLIPKGSHIRICVWEAHHDPMTFQEPFNFDCRRFMESKIPADSYSPFGLDKHRCLGADWTYQLSELLVDELVKDYDWTVTDDGAPVFGKFHFEPSQNFSVDFKHRKHSSS